MKKMISILLVMVLLFTESAVVFATGNSESDFKNGTTLMSEEVIFSKSILKSGVFKPSEMTMVERNGYNKSIDKQVELAKKQYGKNFDSKAFKRELVMVLETDNSLQKLSQKNLSGIAVSASGSLIPDVKIKNSVVAAAINVIIDATLLAAGVGSVTLFLKKVGLSEARKIFTRSIKTKLVAWGAGTLAVCIPVVVDFIFNLLDPGTAAAKYLDKKDSFPNNGYLDLIL